MPALQCDSLSKYFFKACHSRCGIGECCYFTSHQKRNDVGLSGRCPVCDDFSPDGFGFAEFALVSSLPCCAPRSCHVCLAHSGCCHGSMQYCSTCNTSWCYCEYVCNYCSTYIRRGYDCNYAPSSCMLNVTAFDGPSPPASAGVSSHYFGNVASSVSVSMCEPSPDGLDPCFPTQ